MVKLSAGFISDDYYQELFIAKLESSGLTLEQAKELGITLAKPDEVFAELQDKEWHDMGMPCARFAYYDFDGVTPLKENKHWPDFVRFRRLSDVANKAKAARYKQASESGVHPYIPRVMDWEYIIKHPSQEIIITEGELKAAKACVSGFATIGLGGVDMFRSAKNGLIFPKELEKVNWVKRYVKLIFDADITTNPRVRNALMELAFTLRDYGAIPFVLTLNVGDKDKK